MNDTVTAQLAQRMRHLEVVEPIQPRYGDVLVVQADTTLDAYDWVVVIKAGANIIVTLPAASEAWGYYLKRVDATANTVTITPAGTATIDGNASWSLNGQYDGIHSHGAALQQREQANSAEIDPSELDNTYFENERPGGHEQARNGHEDLGTEAVT